jgi:hypothetical protein
MILSIAFDLNVKIPNKRVPLFIIVGQVMSLMAVESQTKIGDFQMTERSGQEVVRFDVAMNPVDFMSFFYT